MAVDNGEPLCQSLTGELLDDFVAIEVLRAVHPAALQINLQAAQEVEAERLQKHRQWQQRLGRAHYDVGRAARQYHAVEPEHRLVARTLERHWEETLNAESQLHANYASFQSEQPACLSVEQQEAIQRPASDITRDLALLNPATDSKLRGCDLVSLRVCDIAQGKTILPRAMVMSCNARRTDRCSSKSLNKPGNRLPPESLDRTAPPSSTFFQAGSPSRRICPPDSTHALWPAGWNRLAWMQQHMAPTPCDAQRRH
jgi:hypothetical protein